MAKRRVHGTERVIGNLNREISQIEGRTMKGLIRSAAFIREDMERKPPLIPVDEGNLRASWFTDPYYQGRNPVVQLGFSANYAWYVHEMVGANFQRPGSGAKFLEAALKRNKAKILGIIKQEARVR